MSTMTAGRLAGRARINVETLRYYERRGLLPAPPRRASGYREYSETDLLRVRFIKRAQELGFTLRDIEDLLALKSLPGASAGDVRQQTERKIREIESKIRDLERMKRVLGDLHARCDGHGPLDDCPILGALSAEDLPSA